MGGRVGACGDFGFVRGRLCWQTAEWRAGRCSKGLSLLSRVVCRAREDKVMSQVEVLVSTWEPKLSQTLAKNTILGEQIWGEIWPNL